MFYIDFLFVFFYNLNRNHEKYEKTRKTMKDTHLHSTVSHDGRSTVTEYIAKAKEIGVDELIFTEHWDDYDGIITKLSTLDVENYRNRFLAEKEKTDFPIRFGIEIGLQPHSADKIKAFVPAYDFDFIIGSSHITRRLDMAYDPKFFAGKTRREAYLQYFEEMLENVTMYDEFDVYGHLDYVVRYGGYAQKQIAYAEFADIMDEIFRVLIKKDKGIEINTSGLRYGIGATHPSLEFLKRFHELGGKIVTIGSDAHKTEDLASHFADAVEILGEAGFHEVAFFRGRKPDFMTLGEFMK